ncbi:MAG: Prephenate dehydrogenase [Acidobacteria bacterium]|nr:Prephenate dehydrogenase [Acidobacteriota bacterium]
MEGSKVTIIGCGLIGGSIALALRRRRPGWSIACIDLPDRLPAIRESGVADSIGAPDDLAALVPDSSLVILATPVHAIPEWIARLKPVVRAGTIVTDVGSTKKQIMETAQLLLPAGAHFIGGHPMAGTEHSGVEAADPLLFSDKVWLLCPYPDTPPGALLQLMDLAEDLLAFPITLDPEEHDRLMAMISHLPQLISVALMHAARAADAGHAMLARLAGRGFLDMTRLAASGYGIWKGILETNREAVEDSIRRFEESLSLLRRLLATEDLEWIWEETAGHRRRLGTDNAARPRKPDLRSTIDHCDKQLLAALGRRVQAVRKMGRLKANQSLPVLDPDREKRMMLQREEWGKSLDLPPELIEELFEVILRHSTRLQRQ